MSYILDALRRADAERARGPGTVPDPGHPAPALPITLAPSPRPRWPLLVGAGLAGGVVVGALAWWGGAWRGVPPAVGGVDGVTTAVRAGSSGSAMEAATRSAGGSAPAPVGPVGVAVGSPSVSRSAADTAVADARIAEGRGATLPAPEAAALSPAAASAAVAGRRAVSASGAIAPVRESDPAATVESGRAPVRSAIRERATSPVPAPAPVSAPAPSPATAPALTRLADLPPALRQRLMALQPGGVVHAASRSQRLVLINGQVFHEGEQPQPGLVLEQIRLKSLVFSLDGYRFEWPL